MTEPKTLYKSETDRLLKIVGVEITRFEKESMIVIHFEDANRKKGVLDIRVPNTSDFLTNAEQKILFFMNQQKDVTIISVREEEGDEYVTITSADVQGYPLTGDIWTCNGEAINFVKSVMEPVINEINGNDLKGGEAHVAE